MRYFRRITRYDYWNLKDLYKLSNLNSKKRKDKIRLNCEFYLKVIIKNIVHVVSIIKAVKENYKVHQLVVV